MLNDGWFQMAFSMIAMSRHLHRRASSAGNVLPPTNFRSGFAVLCFAASVSGSSQKSWFCKQELRKGLLSCSSLTSLVTQDCHAGKPQDAALGWRLEAVADVPLGGHPWA